MDHHNEAGKKAGHHDHGQAGLKHEAEELQSNAVHGRSTGEHKGHTDHSGHENVFRSRFWICLVLSIPVLLYSETVQNLLRFRVPELPFASNWIVPVFSIIVFIVGGLPFLQMAVPELRNRKPGMMTLISMAISVAFLYSLAATFFNLGESFYWELVTLIDIMLLGHWLEMRSVRQASRALDELARLMPDSAERVEADGSTQRVAVNTLRENDVILVRPGSSIAADGEVVDGQSSVSEAVITGESRPVEKTPGSRVIAGTINGDGSLRVRVSATGEATALAGIMRLVKQAQESKSTTQILADKAAGWLFYTALLAALITGIAWGAAIGFQAETVMRVVTVLVIACPHALGLAIPLVVAITTSIGARQGILIRNRLSLEVARDIDTIIFDKTGTLTRGEFGVTGMASVAGFEQDQALAIAAAVEGDSEHLIARAIRNAAQEKGLVLPAVEAFEAIKGRGVKGVIQGKDVYVGSPGLIEMLRLDLEEPVRGFVEQANRRGQTVVFLVADNQVRAAFALADVIRGESKQAIHALQQNGIQVVMLTGDSREVAKAVAEELGIDRFFAEVLPEDKDKKVIELQREGRRVMMVGDGVNDAPALTRADVGVAVGSGTDVAVESADIILMQSNPADVVNIILLSKASYKKMIQNLVWATGYNVVAIPLAGGILAGWGILLTPAVGALLMSLSTIIVAINAQLLRRIRWAT